MNTHRAVIFALLVPALFLVSCSSMNVKSMDLDKNDTIASMAETRLVVSTEVKYDEKSGDRKGPARMVCAEPSPDVAKVFQESFSMASKLAASDASKTINGELAFEFSKAHAEAMAQLGERMATIQLLRDALYRACEAYVNGGFNATMYAVMLSRLDDVMVTLMTSELAAGNFGRPLVTLGGSAEASQTVDRSSDEYGKQLVKAGTEIEKAVKEVDKAKDKVKKAEEAETKVEKNIKKAEEAKKKTEENVKKAENGTPAEKKAAEKELETAEAEKKAVEEEKVAATKAKEDAKKELDTAQKAKATAFANAEKLAGDEVKRTQGVELAKVLAKIQRKYMENINSDALVVACLTELSKTPYTNTKPSELFHLCKGWKDGEGKPHKGILSQVMEKQSELLKIFNLRTLLFLDKDNLDTVKRRKEAIKELIKVLSKEEETAKKESGKNKKEEIKNKDKK